MIPKNNDIYKLRDGLTISPSNYFSKYIKVINICKDNISGKRYITFDYIFIETGEKINQMESEILLLEDFNNNFDFYK